MQYTKDLNTSENNKVYKTFIRLLFDSGLCVSETLNIKISDIDLTYNLICIWSNKTRKFRYAPFLDFSKEYINTLIKKNSLREYLFITLLKIDL